MKKILLIVLALTGLTANAQYFHHIYGTTDGEKLSDGINTTTLGLGHFLVGHRGQNGLSVSRTDVNGNVPAAPYFNRSYQVVSSVTGTKVSVSPSRTFEMDNGNGFGIIGQYTDLSISAPNTGVFYLQLSPTGAVNNIFTYIPAGGGVAFDVVSVGGVSESVFAGGAAVYVAGTTTDGGSRLDPFAMMLDVNSGAVIWSGIYDLAYSSGSGIAFGRDIVESPYSPTGVKEAVMVGQVREPFSGALPDGFTLRIDVNSGAPITGQFDVYGVATRSDEFNTISVAASTTGGSDGFIIGGGSNVTGSNDFWLMKTDTKCGTLWATVFDYTGNLGADNVCLDVIERLNTSGVYEYYAAGYVYKGLLGDYDMLVIKLDDAGNGVGQYTYGDSRLDYGIAIDQYNGTGSDGFSLFGFRQGASSPIINGNYDMYLVKAYFNGLTPCNQKLTSTTDAAGPKLYTNGNAYHVDKLKYYTMFGWGTSSAYDARICFRNALTGGSNARIAPIEEKGDKQAVVSPNPVQAGSPVIAVSIETEMEATAQVAIFDMLGRQYYAGTVTLAKGENTLPIDISKANMSAGTYSVRISYNDVNRTILLMVK